MPEMKNSFQKGRMNKDLDERILPKGEYRHALNVEVATSEGSDVGSLQTIKGNKRFSNLDPQKLNNQKCIGSIVDHKNDKIYWMVSGSDTDMIVEYDYISEDIEPVCVDKFSTNGIRALNFEHAWLITGINIIDGILFWTDNNSEPKRINIERGKQGSNGFANHTNFLVRDVSINAAPNSWPLSVGNIKEEHLTVIKKGPPTAPVLEMIDTNVSDVDGDTLVGGAELEAPVVNTTGTFIDSDGEFLNEIIITTSTTMDYASGDYLIIYQKEIPTNSVRVQISSIVVSGTPPTQTHTITVDILSGIKDIENESGLWVKLEQKKSLFTFKFPRFAYRYKYEDGEYSQFSPFSQPAFLPGQFNYLPKEGYNLGMVNRVRKLVIKDFVHTRLLPDDVISIDILYKESNSPNIYSVKTIKKRDYNPLKWDEWNGTSVNTVGDGGIAIEGGYAGLTKGFMPISTEMIHAVLPANQLLRPWDNVPRKALAQEIVGNRLVYGNYLQNYNLINSSTGDNNIKVDLKVQLRNNSIGSVLPEEVQAGPNKLARNYSPSKSIKSLRTYQIGVTYLDEYGRETPVLSEDKRGTASSTGVTSQASIYVDKAAAPKRNCMVLEMKNNPPEWATHMKFFVKETSNEYYNLAMDRWYDAEDGNVWLSFPSAERNKVDEETFLILKKQHDNSSFVSDPARYKIIAIENEAPRFIKLKNISMGGITDGLDSTGTVQILGIDGVGFPMEGGFFINIEKAAFKAAGWVESLINQDISQVFVRVKSASDISLKYRLKQIVFDNSGLGFYRLECGKLFEGDMAHTSTDGTYLNKLDGVEVRIIKSIPEDRAEFEGRFFVKILKDGELIENLNISEGDGLTYVPTQSKRVQYINPLAIQAPGGWNGFSTDRWKISMDEHQGDIYSRPGKTLDSGDGQRFWAKAGNVSEGIGADSTSSGWFIDAVEGFRPYQGKHLSSNIKGQHIGWRQNPFDTRWWNGCWTWLTGLDNAFDANDWFWANAKGLNNYNDSLGYLGTSGPEKMRSTGDLMQTASASDGGQVAKTVNIGPNGGIDPDSGIIQISYSGINFDGTKSHIGPSTWNDLDSFFNDAAKHAGDEAFIVKLTQPGTLWRWKEDPGKVIYKTKATTGLTLTSLPYTSGQFSRESIDFDGKKGVFLWNYVSFADFPIKDAFYHRLWWTDCFGGILDSKSFKVSWASRNISNTNSECNLGCVVCYFPYAPSWWVGAEALCASTHHEHDRGAFKWEQLGTYGKHYAYPAGVPHWDYAVNKRRRFAFSAEPLLDPTKRIGNIEPHFYLPTNDCTLPGHFNASAEPITQHPNVTGAAGVFDANSKAPGIRPDGMYTGHDLPGSDYQWDSDGDGVVEDFPLIPQYKRWDASQTTFGDPSTGTALESAVPGSVTWEIIVPFVADEDNFTSTNPAVWETEPKEDVGLDIYHEVGQIYPIYLNDNTIEQFVGSVSEDVSRNSYVQCWDPPYAPGGGTGGVNLSTGTSQDIRVIAAKDDKVMLADASGVYLDGANPLHTTPPSGAYLMFWRADGGVTEAHVGNVTNTSSGTWYQLIGRSGEVGVHNKMIQLPWFNCYSFGNGVESDRIRDDYNQVTIDNGPKASTTLEETYVEDRKKNGFIWSGIYNSTSGVNNLNQFIQAEAITKDVNPTYGSIQKMFVRDSDLVAYCEDRVLKVFANKDALYNADGNTNVVATNKVLGAVKPFVGDYGISKNPESFASDTYRSYFADTSRGAVLRLSMDGITPISDVGMKDWFADIMPMYSTKTGSSIIGSFDDKKEEYNITFIDNPYDKEGIPRMARPPVQPVYAPGIGNPPGLSAPTNPPGPSAPTNPIQSARIGAPTNPTSPLSTSYNAGTQAVQAAAGVGGAAPATLNQLAQTQQSTTSSSGSVLRVFDDKDIPETTVSFSEPAKAWVSFKSFIQENGVSLNNSYYTFYSGDIWKHHANEVRNNFYDPGDGTGQYDSSVYVVFNQIPGSIKSFTTLNYEGTQSRVTQDIINNPDYYDNIGKDGWYINTMVSNAQEIGQLEFWDKEDKWFSQIKGVATKWLNDDTAGNIDPREFSYQGIGNADGGIDCPECPERMSWECNEGNCNQVTGSNGYSTERECIDAGCGAVSESWNCNSKNGCIDPGDGSGQYATECECANDCCGSSIIRFFDCQNLPQPNLLVVGCMDDGITQDPWIIANRPNGWVGPASNFNVNANHDDCNCLYSTTVPSWDCITSNAAASQCVDPGTGLGQYATFSSCFDECNVAQESWDCVNGACIDPGTGNGQYATFAGCFAVCNLPPSSTWDCTTDPGTATIPATPGYYANNACDGNTLIANPNSADGMWAHHYDTWAYITDLSNGYGNVDTTTLVFCVDQTNGTMGTSACECNNGLGYLLTGIRWGFTYHLFQGPNVFPSITPGVASNLTQNSTAPWFTNYSDMVDHLHNFAPNIVYGWTLSQILSELNSVAGYISSGNANNQGQIYATHGNSSCNCSGWVNGNPAFPGIPASSNCIEVFDGSGQYPSELACLDVCVPTSSPGTSGCDDGMDVAFVMDYTMSMQPYIEDIKSSVVPIVTQIDTLSGANDYRLSLTIVDEHRVGNPPQYVSGSEYISLPTAQKYISPANIQHQDCASELGIITQVNQRITNMESFGLNNATTFSTQLGKLNSNAMAPSWFMGDGEGMNEPMDVAANLIGLQNFTGVWRNNVAKYIVIFTDNLPGGDDDCFTSTDVINLSNLSSALAANNIKVMVIGAGVDKLYSGVYPWRDFADATDGIWDAANNGNYSQAVINNLATLCDNSGNTSAGI